MAKYEVSVDVSKEGPLREVMRQAVRDLLCPAPSEVDLLTSFCLELVGEVPPEFFFAATSSGGKYHNIVTNGDYGLLKHSIMVAEFAGRYCELFEVSKEERQILLAAALFHDAWKGWNPLTPEWSWTLKEHGTTASDRISFFGYEYVKACEQEEDRKYLSQQVVYVSELVRFHMAQWAKPVPLHVKDMSTVALILTLADFATANQNINGYNYGVIFDGIF